MEKELAIAGIILGLWALVRTYMKSPEIRDIESDISEIKEVVQIKKKK